MGGSQLILLVLKSSGSHSCQSISSQILKLSQQSLEISYKSHKKLVRSRTKTSLVTLYLLFREPGFQAWAQRTCPELSAQGLVPLRWGCALPSPNAPGRAPTHIPTTLRWGRAPGKPSELPERRSSSSAPRRGSAEPRPRGCREMPVRIMNEVCF